MQAYHQSLLFSPYKVLSLLCCAVIHGGETTWRTLWTLDQTCWAFLVQASCWRKLCLVPQFHNLHMGSNLHQAVGLMLLLISIHTKIQSTPWLTRAWSDPLKQMLKHERSKYHWLKNKCIWVSKHHHQIWKTRPKTKAISWHKSITIRKHHYHQIWKTRAKTKLQ